MYIVNFLWGRKTSKRCHLVECLPGTWLQWVGVLGHPELMSPFHLRPNLIQFNWDLSKLPPHESSYFTPHFLNNLAHIPFVQSILSGDSVPLLHARIYHSFYSKHICDAPANNCIFCVLRCSLRQDSLRQQRWLISTIKFVYIYVSETVHLSIANRD